MKHCKHRQVTDLVRVLMPTLSTGVQWCAKCGATRETLDGPTGAVNSPWTLPGEHTQGGK